MAHHQLDLMNNVDENLLSQKKEYFSKLVSFGNYPDEKLTNLSKLGVVFDKLIEE